jgi:HK97 family phage prohead protease
MQIEKRSVMAVPELRAEGQKRTMAGYAAVFNSEANIGGSFREVIMPGAFAETLKSADVRALVDHDSGRVIGRSKAGTLRLKEDDMGLSVEIDLPDTSDGRDIGELVARGDIDGMSFGFRVTHDEWDDTVEPAIRTIHGIELHEVSAVTWPAYADTSLAMRSKDNAKSEADKAKAEFNRKLAEARIALRKATAEQKFRNI